MRVPGRGRRSLRRGRDDSVSRRAAAVARLANVPVCSTAVITRPARRQDHPGSGPRVCPKADNRPTGPSLVKQFVSGLPATVASIIEPKDAWVLRNRLPGRLHRPPARETQSVGERIHKLTTGGAHAVPPCLSHAKPRHTRHSVEWSRHDITPQVRHWLGASGWPQNGQYMAMFRLDCI